MEDQTYMKNEQGSSMQNQRSDNPENCESSMNKASSGTSSQKRNITQKEGTQKQ
jgi:hypothetical protein